MWIHPEVYIPPGYLIGGFFILLAIWITLFVRIKDEDN